MPAIRLTDRRQVGSTALKVPPFGFGAAHVGGAQTRIGGDVARATFQAAWDAGVRFFDTAPWYARGLSEHRVGDFLMDQPRDQFVLTTKVGRSLRRPADPRTYDPAPWRTGLHMEVVWDYGYDGIMRAYEQSLHRLGLDTVDALLVHDPEVSLEAGGPNMEDLAESGIKALEELKRNGHIKAIGMGLNEADSLATFATRVPLDFCIVAMPYTLLDQSALHTGLKRCVDEGVSIVIGAPYASGILATGPVPGARYRYSEATPDILDKASQLAALCTRHGCALPAAALQFALAHPAVVSVIPGGVSPTEVEANVRHVQAPIPPAFWRDLAASGLIDKDAPLPA